MVRLTWSRAIARFATACLLVSFIGTAFAEKPAAAARPAFNYTKAISEARTAWTKHSTRIAQLLRLLKSKADVVTRLDPQIRSLLEDLKALERKKQVELDELRQGMFCSGCGKTRSVILAAGERFPHSGQQSIPASPEQIAAAEKEFDDRIAALRRRLNGLQDDRNQAQAAISDAMHELNNLIHHYHKEMLAEARHRGSEWSDEKGKIEQGLDALQQSIASAEASLQAAGTPDAAAAARANLNILRTQFTTSLQRGQAAEARARQESTSFSATAKGDLERLRQIAADLPQQFGIPGGWYLGQIISTPPLPVSYPVYGLRHYGSAAAGDKLRDLLEGPKKAPDPGPKASPPKSVKDLLEGK